ncbi:MAG: flavin reductase, partial [Treponema sp.]|nr:flavin reductase [Treponema sp.]
MRKNLGAKEILYPMPVLIIATYDENGNADAMNAAWGSIGDTAQVFICLSPEHKTVKNIMAKKAFTVSVGTKNQLAACDYVGIVSGNTESKKIEKSGFTVTKSEFVDAPVINELPYTLECKLISYDEKS